MKHSNLKVGQGMIVTARKGYNEPSRKDIPEGERYIVVRHEDLPPVDSSDPDDKPIPHYEDFRLLEFEASDEEQGESNGQDNE